MPNTPSNCQRVSVVLTADELAALSTIARTGWDAHTTGLRATQAPLDATNAAAAIRYALRGPNA